MATTVKPEKGDKVYRMTDGVSKVLPNGEEIFNTTGNIVNFKCEYSKEFKGEKYMKEGKIYYKLHIVHAEKLEALGIGKVLKDK